MNDEHGSGAAVRVRVCAGAVAAFLGVAAICPVGLGAALARAGAAPNAAAVAPFEVNVQGGEVRGGLDQGVIAFLGIPFAAPPVGELRWEPPQPVVAWHGVLDATSYGADCMQQPAPGDAAPERTAPSENCLYINVWRPKDASARKLPVMVWIYGGGFVNGGSSPAIYSGAPFARDGVVFVSFNYRLGNFGFFGFPALTATNSRSPLANYAFMDQIAALKWVQKNISAFGGDPRNVTLFGESAGGMSVNNLLITPLARGLFERAIVESGAGRGGLTRRTLSGSSTSAEAMGVKLARHFGIDGDGENALGQLRALPASTLLDGLDMGTMMKKGSTYVGGPIVHGKLYMGPPVSVYADHPDIGSRVPVMIGTNSADLGFFPAPSVSALFQKFGAKAAAARAAFDPHGNVPLPLLSLRVGGTQMMIEPARAIARALSSRGQPVYEYRFSYVPSAVRDLTVGPMAGGITHAELGAMHASEIPFVFNTVEDRYGTTDAQDERVAREMHAYWVAFAKTGKPDPAGLPPWPIYNAQTDQILDFTGHGPVAEADSWKARDDVMEWYSKHHAVTLP